MSDLDTTTEAHSTLDNTIGTQHILDRTHHTPFRAAADVSFAPVGGQHAESSSQASARSSLGKRSSTTSDKVSGKEKRMTPDGVDLTSEGHKSRSRKSGGFLLESVLANGHFHGHGRKHGQKGDLPNGRSYGQAYSPSSDQTHNDKGKLPTSRVSIESSQRGSPLSRQFSTDGTGYESPAASFETRSPSVDPAQLVQMALNLSESRKRHVSNALRVPTSPKASTRVASGLNPAYGTIKSAPPTSPNGKLVSGTAQQTPPPSRLHEPDEYQEVHPSSDVLYTFSPATLSRAEKARRYFELASENRRLLEHLPPLKPDASAPENSVRTPEKGRLGLSREPTYFTGRHQLGRSYNPLQALRNRRVRQRERRPITAPPETFQETDRIKNWIDEVVDASREPDFRPGEDQVRLPEFEGEQEDHSVPPSTKGHRKTDTVGSIITRPENGWSIEPAELLADVYWLERGNNKACIEDRQGRHIFLTPSRNQDDQIRRGDDATRRSGDDPTRRSRDDFHDDMKSVHGDSDVEDRRRRRKHILHIPHRLRRNRILLTRSGSNSSNNSSDEGRKPPAPLFDNAEGGDENTGPLERQMRELIAKDERGELSSPEALSPSPWEARQLKTARRRSVHNHDHRRDILQKGGVLEKGDVLEDYDATQKGGVVQKRKRGDTTQMGNRSDATQIGNRSDAGRLSVDTQLHRRARSVDGRVDHSGPNSSSLDEFASESPVSPILPGRMSGRNDPAPKSAARSRLPIFRSRSKDRNHIEHTDFADRFGTTLSPVHSAETREDPQPRHSMEASRPYDLLRHETAGSTTNSLRQSHTTATDISTASSGGRRFFKSGRIGELMRNESSRKGDRFRGSRDRLVDVSDVSRATSDVSDIEDDSPRQHFAAGSEQRDDDSDVSPRGSIDRGQKYYTSNLPSFKSPAGRDERASDSTLTVDNDPISRQQKAQKEAGRSPRFDRLAPPRINLPDDDAISNTDALPAPSNVYRIADVTRQSTTSLRPDSIDSRQNRARSRPDAMRHWSISDQTQPAKSDKVLSRDVARVRALLFASGIKAHEIMQQGTTVRDTPLPVIKRAAQTAGQVIRVPRKDENVVAADMLSTSLTATLSEFEKSIVQFESSTTKNLVAQIDTLQLRAADQLTKLVQETSDEADAFNVELTTKQPLEVKRVDDAVDAMFRQRRRQFRLVRRAGFKLLEWLVLCVMWWVWFIVVLINIARKSVLVVFALLRWLFWF